MYKRQILSKLEQSNLGCFIGKTCYNSFLYADDLILLSITISDLESLANITADGLTKLDLLINYGKSLCLRIGPRHKIVCKNISVNGQHILWENKANYLGITVSKGLQFSCDWQSAKAKFYMAVNSLLSKLRSMPPINLSLKLLSSICYPCLTYGLPAVSLTAKDRNSLSFAYNSPFCKVFNCKSLPVIEYCQYFCNVLPFSALHDFRRYCFLIKLLRRGVIKSSLPIDTDDLNDLAAIMSKYNISHTDSFVCARIKIWEVWQATLNL